MLGDDSSKPPADASAPRHAARYARWRGLAADPVSGRSLPLVIASGAGDRSAAARLEPAFDSGRIAHRAARAERVEQYHRDGALADGCDHDEAATRLVYEAGLAEPDVPLVAMCQDVRVAVPQRVRGRTETHGVLGGGREFAYQ